MRPSAASAFATLASTASAIASPPRPFLLLSTHKSSAPLSVPQYAAQSAVLDTVTPYLSECPTKEYIIVNQADLRSSEIYDASTIPNLRRHAEAQRWGDRLEVGEVHDSPIDGEALASLIRSKCPGAAVETQYLSSLGSGDSRDTVLADNDYMFGSFLSKMASLESVTLIYYGGTVDSDLEALSSKHQYVAEFPDDGSQIELKPRFDRPSVHSRREDDEPEWPTPPDTTNYTWFQTHSWLSEAQTAIIITLVPFFLIIFAAIKAVTGIQIPYGSFETDYVVAVTSGDKKKSH